MTASTGPPEGLEREGAAVVDPTQEGADTRTGVGGKAGLGPLSRRQLMKGVAGTAAGVAAGSALTDNPASAAPTASQASQAQVAGTNLVRSVDVAVVGAGISGLYAAYLLSQQPGTTFAVLEARGRRGGRIINASIGVGNQVVEAGAEFIGADDTLLRQLVIDDFQLPIYDTFGDKAGQGAPLVDFGKKPEALSAFKWPLVPPDIAAEAAAMVHELDEMAFTVDLQNPMKSPHAASWDVETFQSWLNQNIQSPEVRTVAKLSGYGLFGGAPADSSLLHFMYSLHGHEGVEKTGGISGGAQQNRVVGGTQLITDTLAERIGHENIMLQAPVRLIDQSKPKIVLTTDAGQVQASAVILAVPPPFAGEIEFNPLLSPRRAQLYQRFPMGYAVKVHATYPTPFWRQLTTRYPNTPDGLSGIVLSEHGPVTLSFDNSPGGASATTGVLLGFVFGNDARGWSERPPASRRSLVLAQFARWYGDQAANPIHYMEQDWSREEWTRGYIGYMTTNAWRYYGGLVNANLGRVYLAGSETSGPFVGGMEAGLRAAERAVDHATA